MGLLQEGSTANVNALTLAFLAHPNPHRLN